MDKATGGMLPKVAINGEVATYFSLDYGKIVSAESVLNFDVNLKGGFKTIAELLGSYTGMLDELEGGSSYDLMPAEDDAEQEPPGICVHTVITLK